MKKLPFKLKKKNKKPKNRSFLTIDVGSQTVKSLAFTAEHDEAGSTRLKLIGIGKEWLEPFSVRSGNIIDVEKVAKALDAAIYKTTEGLTEDIDDVIFGVSGNICDCLVTTGKLVRKQLKPINEKEIQEMDTKIIEAAITKTHENVASKTGNYDAEMELITSATVYTKVDGVNEKNPIGKEGKEIETAIFTAFTPTYFLNKLEELASLLNLNVLAVTSNLYAINESIKLSTKDPELDCVIIDIGSDTTDVAVVFGGGIVASKSMQLGGNQFTKQISMKTGLTFAEAEKKKYDYTYGNMSDEEAQNFINELNGITNLWLRGLELLFNEFEGVKTFASTIYITGGGSKLPVIMEALENNPWTKSIPFKEPPEILSISINNLSHLYDITGEAKKEELVVSEALSVIHIEMQEEIND